MRGPASVSAIIPAFNAERFLAEAIGSVLAQTLPVADCVVVDDGSDDGTPAVVQRFQAPVKLVRQDNRGVSAARNRGAQEASGELLAFLDADDIWHPRRLERQLQVLSAAPGCEAVVCGTRVIDGSGTELGTIRPAADATAEQLLLWRTTTVSVSSNLLIRRKAFEEIGGFDESLSTSADWALTYRLLERGALHSVDEPLVTYRIHGANMSTDLARFERDMMSAYSSVFADASPEIEGVRRRAYANLHRTIAGSYFVERRFGGFARHAVRSLTAHPSVLPYFLGMPVRRLTRRVRRSSNPLTSLRAGGRPRG